MRTESHVSNCVLPNPSLPPLKRPANGIREEVNDKA